MNKTLIVLGVLGILLISIFLIDWKFGEEDIISIAGTIKYIPLERGFYGIITEKGDKYLPINLPEEFKKDGLKIEFKAKLKKIATIQMWGKPIEILEIKRIETTQNLHQIKVAILYQRITDGIYHPSKSRTYEDLVNILKETNPDLVFRVWWRWVPTPEFLPPDDPVYQAGHTYQQFEETLKKLKRDLPEVRYWFGAIPTQRINLEERNPIKGKTYSQNETWEIALAPQKWGINFSKEELQKIAQEKGGSGKYGYFPDITNKKFQELYLSWAKRQIDAGVNGLFLDMLFAQPRLLAKITGNPEHQAVKESLEAIDYLIKEIRNYGYKKGEYIYLCSFGTFTDFPDYKPDLDFIVVTLTMKEVRNLELDEKRWDEIVSKVRERIPKAKILAVIDWAGTTKTSLGVFSQELSKDEQKEFLRIADEFFQKRGIIFVYPVHGGFMGQNAKILSYGKLKNYDSLAPEFETYETIKELAQNKKVPPNVLNVKVAIQYRYVTDGNVINRTLDDIIKIFKETKADFVFQAWMIQKPLLGKCTYLSPEEAKKYRERGYSYQDLVNAVSKIKRELPSIILCGGTQAEFLYPEEVGSREKAWNMSLNPEKWGVNVSRRDVQCYWAKRWGHIKEGEQPTEEKLKEIMPKYFPDLTNPEFQEVFLDRIYTQIDAGVDAIWIDMLYAQAHLMETLTKDPNHPAVKDSYRAAWEIVNKIHEYGRKKDKYIYVITWVAVMHAKVPKEYVNVDAAMVSPSPNEIKDETGKVANFNEELWDKLVKEIRKEYGIPIFARIDYGGPGRTPLYVFSQELTKEEAREFLRKADEFFSKKGIIFIYPLHGGDMGRAEIVKKLSYGKFNWYDALAPEFETYETIKELTKK